jgi:hypothetical protein
MFNVDIVRDPVNAGHLTDDRFGSPLSQAPIDLAIQIHNMVHCLHPDRTRRS